MGAKFLFSLVSAMLMGGFATAKPSLAIDSDFPDPCVIYADDGYYAFGTASKGVNIQIAYSKNFSSWELLSEQDALPGPFPSWVGESPRTWAPDVVKRDDGKYIMYYSATAVDGGKKHCIGAASSNNITGPYTPHNESLACPLDKGGAIDAAGFYDDDTYYVVYKVDGNGLNNGNGTQHPTPLLLQELDDDAMTPVGKPTELLDRIDSDGPLVEAPSLLKLNGTYYLSYSTHMFNTKGYDMSFATASSLTGPYERARDSDNPVLGSGDSSDSGKLAGPGGSDFSEDGTKIVFHAFENGEDMKKGRAMYVADIEVSGGKIELC